MATEQLITELRADISQFRTEISRATRLVQDQGREIKRSAERSARSLDQLAQGFRVMRTAILGLGIAKVAKDILSAGASMEATRNAFEAFTGSAEAGAAEIAFVRQEAQRLGLEFTSTIQSYKGLAAASRGTSLEGAQSREIFTAVAEASTVMGLTADQTSGALTALQQIMSKGTVQAEELRGQLGERIPGAFQIAARAMGTTTTELGKLLEQGRITADEFLPRFAAQLRKEMAGGVERASESAIANFNRLRNAITDVQIAFADSGFANAVARMAVQITESLREALPTIGEIALVVGESFVALREGIAGVINVIFEGQKNFNAFRTTMRAIGNIIFGVTEALAFNIQGFINFINVVKSLPGLFSDPNKTVLALRRGLENMAAAAREAQDRFIRLNMPTPDEMGLTRLNPALEVTETVADKIRDRFEALRKSGVTSIEDINKSLEKLLGKRTIPQINAEIQELERRLRTANTPGQIQAIELALEQLHEEWLKQTVGPEILAQAAMEAEALEASVSEAANTIRDQFNAALKKTQEEAEALAKAQEEFAEKAKRAAEERARAAEQFFGRVEDRLADVFQRGFDGSLNLLETLKESFFSILAQMAARAATTQLIIPATVALFGSGGIGGAAQQAGIFPGLGGGQLLSGIPGLGNLLNIPVLPGATDIAGLAGSGAVTTQGGLFSGGFGLAGQGVSLGGVLGGAGLGVGTGFLTSDLLEQLGLGGAGNNVLSGALGGGIAGLTLGGPIGAGIGALIGSIGGFISSLFGKQTPEFRIEDIVPASFFQPGGPGARLGERIPARALDLGSIFFEPFNVTLAETEEVEREIENQLREGFNVAVGTLFTPLIALLGTAGEEIQESALPDLQRMTARFNAAIEGVRFEGEDVAEQVQQFLGVELPAQFQQIFGAFSTNLQQVLATAQGFEQVIAGLEQRRAQLFTTIGTARQGIVEALFSTQELFAARQAELAGLLLDFRTGTVNEQAQLTPAIAALAQEVFGLAQRPDVLGENLTDLTALQSDLLGILDELKATTQETFQREIDRAQEQVSLLTDTLVVQESMLVELQRLNTLFQQSFVGSFQSGGVVPRTGIAQVHQGEQIIPQSIDQSTSLVVNINGVSRAVEMNPHEIRTLIRQVTREQQLGRFPAQGVR